VSPSRLSRVASRLWAKPSARSVDEARRAVQLRTLPAVLAGYAALLAADHGRPLTVTAARGLVVLTTLLALAVARDVLPRARPPARVRPVPGLLLSSPVAAAGVVAAGQVERLRSLPALVTLLAPLLAAGLAVAGGTGDAVRPALRVLGVFVVAGTPLVLAAVLLSAVSSVAVPALLVPLHLLLVRAALA